MDSLGIDNDQALDVVRIKDLDDKENLLNEIIFTNPDELDVKLAEFERAATEWEQHADAYIADVVKGEDFRVAHIRRMRNL